MFGDFMQWVNNYNEYIINAYSEKATKHDDDDDVLDLDGLVDIEVDEEVA